MPAACAWPTRNLVKQFELQHHEPAVGLSVSEVLAFFFCLNQLTFEVEDLDKEGSRGRGRVVAGRVAQTRPLLPVTGTVPVPRRAGHRNGVLCWSRALPAGCPSADWPNRAIAGAACSRQSLMRGTRSRMQHCD